MIIQCTSDVRAEDAYLGVGWALEPPVLGPTEFGAPSELEAIGRKLNQMLMGQSWHFVLFIHDGHGWRPFCHGETDLAGVSHQRFVSETDRDAIREAIIAGLAFGLGVALREVSPIVDTGAGRIVALRLVFDHGQTIVGIRDVGTQSPVLVQSVEKAGQPTPRPVPDSEWRRLLKALLFLWGIYTG